MTDMSKQTEALKLAEDALKRVRTQDMELVQMSMIALAAIREALAEQPAPVAKPRKQEPVAWMYPDDYERMTTSETFCTVYSVEVGSATRGESTVALYTSPPAQRKPLTDEEIEKLREKTFSTGNPYCPVDSKSMRKAARAIEAAHGIKGDA